MANRHNHYEAAFEGYIRARGIPYVAVDEARRCLLGEDASLKSLDFIVSIPGGATWLIDVKGRRFPSGDARRQYWKNWATRDDLQSLARWEGLFGGAADADIGGSRGLLVFAYYVLGRRSPLPAEQLFRFRGRSYGFVAMTLSDYARAARPISPRWDTWAVPAPTFRRQARPFCELSTACVRPRSLGLTAAGATH